jgi:glycosyltransferase involved in cell wall biosynthesis
LKKNILILTRYESLGASSRVRFYQFLEKLDSELNFEIAPFFSNDYLKNLYVLNKKNYFHILKFYFNRLKKLFFLNKYHFIWIEKEVFPFLPGFVEYLFLKKKNYILDFDDAIFHNYDFSNILLKSIFKNKFSTIAKNAYHITVGNNYLYNYFAKWNNNISYLYSVVNELDFVNINLVYKKKSFTIGWIGSPSTTKYLDLVVSPLNIVSEKYKIKLVLIGSGIIYGNKFEVDYIPWDISSEINFISQFDVGIMPLIDSHWERGKCGFKLIQYMACGIPVIASPVGINNEIVNSDVGFLADSNEEWIYAFTQLITNIDLRKKMGINSRIRIEQNYSFSNNLSILEKIFLSK